MKNLRFTKAGKWRAALFFCTIFSLGSISQAHAPLAQQSFTKQSFVKVIKLPMAVQDYARARLISLGQGTQFECLDQIFTHESHWNPKAFNHEASGGQNAGGIPQILGLNTRLHAYTQVDLGLAYINRRYGSACNAWQFWQKHNYY